MSDTFIGHEDDHGAMDTYDLYQEWAKENRAAIALAAVALSVIAVVMIGPGLFLKAVRASLVQAARFNPLS